MKTLTPWIFITFPLVSIIGQAATSTDHASETRLTIAEQRQKLAANTYGHGFGPQSPRDLDTIKGSNPINFGQSPKAEQMNLCNIHFHKNAEHKGGEFTQFAGEGNGHGYQTGYQYSGKFPP